MLFTKQIRLFKLFGTELQLDGSWLFFVMLVLAMGALNGGMTGLIGSATMIGILFTSITGHEYAHIAMARVFKVRTPKIILNMFGGAAMMSGEIPFGFGEAMIALAGPVFSIAVAGILINLTPADSFLHFIGSVNLILGIFNLIPAFPMDGGRILRGIIFMVSKRPVLSTKIAVYVGWAMLPLILFLTNGSLWILIILSIMALSSFTELKRVQQKYAK